ncbi:pyridoxal-phosphate dependent enzyme [Nocardia concava]|uniref:pyridoxal-phosphate dependent enzyme n=1 Tax=Nocardia concava TaxID=257281 RepID=UPI0002E0AB34|nr:pyridoxal-phosphate dependent enzyme [Nocardia concava]
MRYDHITELIGNTPLLRLDPAVHGLAHVELYAKLESCNPFGSVKDRVAWGMIRDDLDDILARKQTFIEASSGNTAKALRILAAMHGIGLRAVTNRIKVAEVRELLQLLGTDIEELPGLSECPDPTAPNDVYSVIESTMARTPGAWYHPSQYTSEKNIEAHYQGTGREIHEDLARDGITRVDYLIGGLGTTGSTRGTATFLRKHNPELKTIAVVSERSDFIPGIRSETEMWDVGLFQPDFYDRIIPIESTRAVDATMQLATAHGVLAGPTSGATYAAALDHLKTLAPQSDPLVAVFIVCDRLEPYLSYIRKRRPELFGKPGRAPAPTPDELSATPTLSPDALESLDLTSRPTIVDTRGAMAYRIAHIPGALNIRDDQLDDVLVQGIPFSRSRPVVFVCPVGEISLRFAALARRSGYDALSLAGGITAWRDAGKPMESAPRPD